MAVFRPKRNGVASKFYVFEFVYQGKRFQESTGATSKTVAKEYEKQRKAELERAAAGLPSEEKTNRIRTVSEMIRPYLEAYGLNHRPKSLLFATGRLAQVKKRLGNVLLSDLTEERIRGYIRQRLGDGVSGRTINMELGELSRTIGHEWSVLWPKIRKQEEHKDVGRALAGEEQTRLLDAMAKSQSVNLRSLIPILLLTGMRSGEAKSLGWIQVNFLNRVITVGRAKTSSGTGRVIPINDELTQILLAHRVWFIRRFGQPRPEHFVFPWGSPEPTDPSRHMTDVKRAWSKLRKQADVRCRLHDLRHTFATGLAENGTAESTMLSLLGHMSRSMLERYSHIRMAAKRDAVSNISLRTTKPVSETVPVEVPVAESSPSIQ